MSEAEKIIMFVCLLVPALALISLTIWISTVTSVWPILLLSAIGAAIIMKWGTK